MTVLTHLLSTSCNLWVAPDNILMVLGADISAARLNELLVASLVSDNQLKKTDSIFIDIGYAIALDVNNGALKPAISLKLFMEGDTLTTTIQYREPNSGKVFKTIKDQYAISIVDILKLIEAITQVIMDYIGVYNKVINNGCNLKNS